MKNAIILAAGVSRRLYPHTWKSPKCLLKIGNKSIIDFQLGALEKNGVSDITVIVGYYREMIREYLESSYPELNFNFITNHHYFETNTAFSLSMARDVMQSNPSLLMNADVLYPESLLEKVLKHPEGNVLAVDIKKCGREEVKVIEGGEGTIIAIGKELIEEQCLGEFIGVAKFSNGFNRDFSKKLENLVKSGGKTDYFEAAIHPLLSKHRVVYADVSDQSCTEIDFLEDLEKARRLAHDPVYDEV